jgi:HEAT repeat protein
MASRATDALERLGDRSLVAPMLEILTDPAPRNDWLLPDFARDLLKRLAIAADAPAITQAVGKVPPGLRPDLVTILADLPGADPAAAVSGFLEDDDERVRQVVAEALGRSKDPGASSLLVEALGTEPAENVLRAILQSLGTIADPASIPGILESLKREPRPRTDDGLTIGLETLLRFPGAAALKAVTTVLETEFPEDVQADAVLALGRIDHPDAVPLLLKQLSSSSLHRRRNAARALGDTYDPRALPRLLDALRDPMEVVRQAAREAIDKIRFDLETRKLASGGAPAAAGATGELVRQLADESPAVRAAAARSLGRLRAREALPALVRARKDSDAAVREAIEAALDAIAAADESK